MKELPGVVPQGVYDALISSFVGKWENICLRWFVGIQKYAAGFVNVICQRHFGSFKSGGLHEQARLFMPSS